MTTYAEIFRIRQFRAIFLSRLFAIAAAVALVAARTVRLGVEDHPPRATGAVVARTTAVNRQLWPSPALRPLLLMMWVPNGLIVGCEALFIPYDPGLGGYLFAAGAVGMLAGDVVIGRFLPETWRDRLIVPLRVLLAAPFLLFPLDLPLPVMVVLVTVSAFGYPASLLVTVVRVPALRRSAPGASVREPARP